MGMLRRIFSPIVFAASGSRKCHHTDYGPDDCGENPLPSGNKPCRARSANRNSCPADQIPVLRVGYFSAFRRVYGAGSVHGCDTTATANDRSAALDEGPVPKLAGRLSQLRPACSSRSVRTKRRVLEAVSPRRAETEFLLRRPGLLPRRHCRRERASDCRCVHGSGLRCHRSPFRSAHRTAAMPSETTPTLSVRLQGPCGTFICHR